MLPVLIHMPGRAALLFLFVSSLLLLLGADAKVYTGQTLPTIMWRMHVAYYQDLVVVAGAMQDGIYGVGYPRLWSWNVTDNTYSETALSVGRSYCKLSVVGDKVCSFLSSARMTHCSGRCSCSAVPPVRAGTRPSSRPTTWTCSSTTA